MNTKEKILLVQLLLEDIKNDNSRDCEKRASKAKTLCKELVHEAHNEDYGILADFCDTFINVGKKFGDWDGRMFRNAFPMGCERMNKLHGLNLMIKNKSNDFQNVAKEHLLSPEDAFVDWFEWNNK